MVYERIEKALNQAIKLHNGGLSANDSITKVAREEELNPETISRVVEAFNIAKTKAYVKVASDKAADFDIADKKVVIKAAFAQEPKQATEKTASFHSDDDFSAVFTGGVVEEDYKVSRSSERSTESRVKEAFHAIDEQNRELSVKREEVIEAKENFTSALKEATDLLQYSHEREKVAEYAAQIFSEYSDTPRAGKILGLVARCNGIPMSDMAVKLASYTQYVVSPFIDAFEKMVDADSRYSLSVNLFNESLCDAVSKQAEFKGLLNKVGGFVEEKSHASDFFRGSAPKAKAISHKFAEFPTDLVKDITYSLFEEKIAEEKKNDSKSLAAPKVPPFLGTLVDGPASSVGAVQKLVAPTKTEEDLAGKGYALRLKGNLHPKAKAQSDHEVENIKREAILRELMHDEIISQQDPGEVANAYNAMSELAPHASMIKDVVRSVLRQGTAQTIDPHFANSLVELEHNLLKTKNFVPGAPAK